MGGGTEEFSKYKAGEEVSIMGPLGNGFPLKQKKAFLIGGGIGIPPMLELARNLDLSLIHILECPDCGKKISVFGESHIDQVAEEHGIPVLARIPICLLYTSESNGELLVKTEDGSVKKVMSGEVSVRGIYGYV